MIYCMFYQFLASLFMKLTNWYICNGWLFTNHEVYILHLSRFVSLHLTLH